MFTCSTNWYVHVVPSVATKQLLFPGKKYYSFWRQLYATYLDLGSCWAGFVQLCAGANYPPILKLMKVNEGVAVVGALMAGFPKYTYKRLVDRNPLQVNWL
jgi:hypothetical protein